MSKETRGRKRNRHTAYQPIMVEGIPKMREWERDYQEFWKTQLDRCINGYKPSGHAWIPGRYYFYLNFVKFPTAFGGSTRKVMDFPFYRDIDHEYFQKVEDCKRGGRGLIVLKARRKGMSMNNVGGICLYELTIQRDVNMGVGCFLEDDVLEFRRKFENLYSELPPYMVQSRVSDNKDEISFGRKMPDGIIKGSRNTLYFKHFYQNSGAFRGTSLDFLLFEEAGENLNLINSFLVSEECFKEGSYQFGTPIVFGTSNQINNGLKDLEELWYNHDKYNLDQMFIGAPKAYYPFFDVRTGKSEIEKATDDILVTRKKKKALQDKRAYFTYLQEMPLQASDCFIAGTSSIFNLELIHEQIEFLTNNKREKGRVMSGNLEWDINADGELLMHSVKWVPERHGKMKMLHPPLEDNNYVDVGGVDPYYKDESVTSDSLGSLHIYRGIYDNNDHEELPVFEYVDRPKAGKEAFYEECAKVAVFYKCKLLIEDTDEEFFKWFKHHGFAKYLKRSPVVYKSLNSRAANQYGYNMSGQGRKIKLVDTVNEYINKHNHKIYFMELLKEFTTFGIKNTDRVMSFGLALIHSKDNSFLRLQEIREENSEIMKFPVFTKKMERLNSNNLMNLYNRL